MAYRHLTSVQRTYIEVLYAEGQTLTEIAERIAKHKSTVSRELKRNASTGIPYKADFAQFHSSRRKIVANKQHRKIADGSLLERHILGKLRLRWSPDEIRGDLPQYKTLASVCNETIYSFIKKRHPEFKRYLLILSHKNYRKRGCGKREIILNRRMINERPTAIESRKRLGHWEGDTVVSKCRNKAIATFAERKSGYLLAGKMENRGAVEMRKVTVQLFRKSVPKCLRKTCTNDNGPEFAEHQKTEKSLTMTRVIAQ